MFNGLYELNDFGHYSKKGLGLKSHTCNCKKGSDWLKGQHNI